MRASLQAMADLYVAVKALILERQRLGWSRNIGAGFTDADIEDIQPWAGFIVMRYSGHSQRFQISELNLRELDAVAKWLEQWNDKGTAKLKKTIL